MQSAAANTALYADNAAYILATIFAEEKQPMVGIIPAELELLEDVGEDLMNEIGRQLFTNYGLKFLYVTDQLYYVCKEEHIKDILIWSSLKPTLH